MISYFYQTYTIGIFCISINALNDIEIYQCIVNTMDAKEQLVKTIQEWVRLDNEIRKLKKEEKSRKDNQKKLSAELMGLMKNNAIDEVDINNGKLMYSKKNVRKPITKKNLLGILSKFYKGDITKATEINDFIVDNREEVTVESIVRKIKDN